MSEEKKATEPTVKLHAKFKVGEQVIHAPTGEKHTLIALDEKAGTCRLSESAANSPLTVLEKITTA
jgi:hypothetical protein